MTGFIVSHFIKYGGVFLGGDPAKRDENHKIRSAPSGRDIDLSDASKEWKPRMEA
jgi:hypothetical protein